MQRFLAGEIENLMAARRPPSHYNRGRGFLPHSRQQLPLPDDSRNLVVVLRIAERPRHPAATRVGIDNLGARNLPEKPQRRRDQPHRLLMTMSVKQNLRRTSFELQVEAAGEFLKRNARLGDNLSPPLFIAAQQ